jgi:beta-glucosidase
MASKQGSAFPADFVWGASTSAYQIEGAWDADGKGPSVWDDFCHYRVPAGSTGNIPGQVYTPGNVFQNQTGDVASDHYNRFAEDVGLMQQMKLQAYRLSISWPRVVPDGDGKVNAKGLDFYDRLIDALLAKGIEPWVTLFHWDVPRWCAHRGSWLNREMHEWFGTYTQVVVDRLGDRVSKWMTINEPQIFLGPTEFEGLQTSNKRASHYERLLAAHHCMMAHGRSVQVIRARAKKTPMVGWAPIGRAKAPYAEMLPGHGLGHPAGDGRMLAEPTPENIEAAKRSTLGIHVRDFWNNAWFADPIVLGHYPEDGLRLYGSDMPKVEAADMKLINQPIDFYGLNIYSADLVRACKPYASNAQGADATIEEVTFPAGHPRTAIGWHLLPESLYYCPKWLYERYKVPLVITENGLSCIDWVSMDGKVHDPQRVDYTRRYLLQLKRAMDEGTKMLGYFHWSLMDNMEWQNGYRDRFGLIHVDFTTQKRTIKEAGHWYRKVIESNGASLRD